MQINPIENVKSTETKLVFRSLDNARRALHIEEILLKEKNKLSSRLCFQWYTRPTNPVFNKSSFRQDKRTDPEIPIYMDSALSSLNTQPNWLHV